MCAELDNLALLFAHSLPVESGKPSLTIEEQHSDRNGSELLVLTGLNSFRSWFWLRPDKDRQVCFACKSQTSCLHSGRGCDAKNLQINSPLLAIGSDFLHHKACDVILIGHNSGTFNITYLEMKSGAARRLHEQLKSMSCFIKYVLSIYEATFNKQIPFKERFVCIHYKSKSTVTRKSLPSVPVKESSPANPIRIEIRNEKAVFDITNLLGL